MSKRVVFASFSDLLGLDKEMALKIGSGFGGGIARKQEVCGAVSGAVMIIGLKSEKYDLMMMCPMRKHIGKLITSVENSLKETSQ